MITNQKRSSTLLNRILKALGFGFGLLVVFLLAANLLFTIYYSKRILPGVTMNGVPLGGLTINEASSEIGKAVTFPESGTILLMTGDKTWAATPVQLGVYLDPQASAKAAYAIGRKVQFWISWQNAFLLLPASVKCFQPLSTTKKLRLLSLSKSPPRSTNLSVRLISHSMAPM